MNEEQIKEIENLYKSQCPVLWNSGMNTEQGLIRLLAVGRKHDLDYVTYCVDDYSRVRIEKINESKGIKEGEWSMKSPHVAKLKRIGAIMKNFLEKDGQKKLPNGNPKYKKVDRACHDIVRGGVISFGKRFTPKLVFQSLKKINDDIKPIVLYIDSTVQLIHSIIKNQQNLNKGVCPFQIDICFAMGAPKATEEKDTGAGDDDEDDDDDGDDEEENKDYVDYVDDIKKKLEKNKLSYQHDLHEPELEKTGRVLIDLYQQHEKTKEEKRKDYAYPYRKRFVVMIDRRESKNKEDVKDNVYLYDPPKGKYTRDMPENDLLPHWGFAASRTCLLPNTEYDEKDAIASDKDKAADRAKRPPKDTNIGTNNHCKGGLMTLSFHVKSENEIKIYLFWNGNMIRFMPEDIKTVLQRLFVDSEENKSYLKDEEGDLEKLIEDMKGKIVDAKFESFRKSYMIAHNV